MTTTYNRPFPSHFETVLQWVDNTKDERFQKAMNRKCEVCGANKNRPCWNTIDSESPLPGRIVHYGRLATL